jgi:hypothetical protein
VIDGCLVVPFTSRIPACGAQGNFRIERELLLSPYIIIVHGQTDLLDSMHRCLNVDEIVRPIACELVASGGKATAVGLACCCKSFEDPALDALWAEQDSLLPLLKTFPGDVWKEGGYTVSISTTCIFSFLNYPTRKSFKRLPTTMEWARFRKCARRMRKFTQNHTSYPLSPEVFSVIQFCGTINEPLLPNLKTLKFSEITEWFVPFVPLFLSARTTSINFKFKSNLPEAVVASMLTVLPTLCPNLQEISLYALPSHPVIRTAVSGMLLVTNRSVLQQFYVYSPLTEEASEVLYKLPNLRDLRVKIERGAPLPLASLPNLTNLTIKCENEDDWPRLFHGATLGKLGSVAFHLQSTQIGDFLGTFERAALSSSLQNTLSNFLLSTSCSWNPNYSSLLPFTQLVHLEIYSPCDGECSSTVDDNIIINLSRSMPKLETFCLGGDPCHQTTAGVTTKGLVALARHCPNLRFLRIHFQVDSFIDPPAIPGMVSNDGPAASWTDCALTDLMVGDIPMPEESALIIALTLLRIFPWIEIINGIDEGWGKVENAINHSKGIINRSSQQHPFSTP